MIDHNLQGGVEAETETVVFDRQDTGVSGFHHPHRTPDAQPHLRQAMHHRIRPRDIEDRPRFTGFEQVQRNHKSCFKGR